MNVLEKGLIPIRQIAKLTDVSVDSLKHYEKIGLIKPEYINAMNAYRFYSINQVSTILLIKELRALDFSLNEIREYLNRKDVEQSIRLIQSKLDYHQKVVERLGELTYNLKSKLDNIRRVQMYTTYKELYYKKDLPQRSIICFNEKVYDKIEENLAVLAFSKVSEYESPVLMQASFGVKIKMNEIDEAGYLGTPFLLDSSKKEKHYGQYREILPAGKYLCSYHKGSIRNSKDNVRKLLDRVEEEGISPCGDLLFFSLIDEFITDDEKEMVYEIQLQIRPKVQTCV